MTTDARAFLLGDELLKAVDAVQALPEEHPDRTLVEQHAGHLASRDAYRDYYATMRGEACPEEHVFRRHEQVKRFAIIRQRILDRKHKTVLDLGCLDGWCLLNLAASGIRGVGVDLCSEALTVGQERAKKWGFPVWFVESAIEDYDILLHSPTWASNNNMIQFDAVILSEVLEHVLDPAACFRAAVRNLRPGGIVYVSVPATPIPHHGKLEDAREHLRVYSENDLIALACEAGLAVVVDRELIHEEDQGVKFANRTISFRRATISVYCNHVTGGWRPDDRDALNGSEEMVVRVAEAWGQQGHEVQVHQNGARPEDDPCRGEERWVNGVEYMPRTQSPTAGRDFLVLFKTLDHADLPAQSTVFWTTDLPAEGAAATFLPPRVADRLTAVICISEYHRTELLKACPWIDPAKVKAHWLGVDEAELDAARATVGPNQVDGRVVYASSPDRGLGFLLEQWPTVREAVPNAELRVAYGFDFWRRSEAVLPTDQAEAMRKERERLEVMLTQPGVTNLGRLSREAFLKELASAEVWAYPCTGGELCCKTALEAQLLGAYPVVVPTMALAETVQIGSKVTPEEFTAELILVLKEHSAPAGGLTVPGWSDLAMWLWNLADVRVAEGAFSKEKEAAVPALPPVQEPIRFVIPARVSAPPTGLDLIVAAQGMAFDGETDRQKSLGGSETTAIQLSRELVKRGHRVTVFSNLPGQPGKFDGVSYMPVQEFQRYAGSTPHDVCIVQRDPMGFNQPLQSKLNVLWCHDLGLLRYKPTFRSSLWNVDYVSPVSHWHGQQLREVYDLSPETLAPMRNGIDLEAIRRATDRKTVRDAKALVYAARPERGLDLLLQSIMPRLLEREPKLTLYVCGYDNTTQEMVPFYTHCQQLIANLGPRAKWMGHLKKAELYGLYSRARCYVYPSRSFKEVSCISGMEAAACGLPFVGSVLGALPETTGLLPGFAELISHPGREASEEYISRFVEAVLSVVQDDEKFAAMSAAGKAGAATYSWVDVAREWEDFLVGAIELRSMDKRRLVRYWWRLGDLNGIAALPKEDQDAGGLTTTQADALATAPPDVDQPPSQGVMNALAQATADVKPRTILGLGTHGPTAARLLAQMVGAQAVDQAPADFVFGVETLDCAPDPSAYIKEAEAHTTPRGIVCFVTAAPGTHRDRLHQGQPRRRRWVFDAHDVRELLGGKKDLLAMIVGGGGLSSYDGAPLAWSLYRYRVGDGPAGQLDLVRRRWLQSPALSLSACMIVKNEEASVGKCLRSIRPYVDELIVDDNGSQDTTKTILERYGASVETGPSPLEVGFDEARNRTIARSTGDMILWIDADEELLNTVKLPKYLRWNLFNGYAVAQHHFSAEPPNAFKPDLPVRLFRRMGLNGVPTGIRFFGVVHEHPEIAINSSVGQSVVLSDVHISHTGYLTETVRRRRFQRNIPLMFRDRVKYPDRVLGKFLMIRDWCHLARYALEQNGRQLTPEAVQYLEAAVESFQTDFLGAMHVMAVDGLAYYNEALQHLGRGFEVNVALKVGGLDGAPHEMTYSGRVASPEDLEKLVSGSARELTGIWHGEYL